MKSRKPYYLLLIAFLFSFVSCSKEVSVEHNQNPPVGPGTGNFTATINGNAWTADSLQGALINSGVVSISGLGKTGEQISMILPSFKPGTYNINSLSSGYALYVNLNDSLQNVYLSNTGTGTGTVIISSIDSINKTVTGTFLFVLTNPVGLSTKVISKGVFNSIPYLNGTVPPPPSGGTTDTLLATIDGTKFEGSQIQINSIGGFITIAGISSDGNRNLDLIMPSTLTPGAHTFNDNAVIKGAFTPGIAGPTRVSDSVGTLTILSNDMVAGRIIGTFSFTANSVTDSTVSQITKGYFAVKY